MIKLPKEIEERFNELPKTVQDTILNSGWEKTTRNIVDKYNLRIDQGASIEQETMFVMFGFDDADDFTKNIMNEAGIKEDLANKITEEINRDIFKLITDRLVEKTNDEEATEPFHTDKEAIKNTPVENPHKTILSKDIEQPENQTIPEKTNSIVTDNLQTPKVEVPAKLDPYLEPID